MRKQWLRRSIIYKLPLHENIVFVFQALHWMNRGVIWICSATKKIILFLFLHKNKWCISHEKGPCAICRQPRPWSGLSLSAYRISGYSSICWWTECLDQTAQMHMLIWTYHVSKLYKGLFHALHTKCYEMHKNYCTDAIMESMVNVLKFYTPKFLTKWYMHTTGTVAQW